MKNYNKILEAVNRGIQLALDDFDDEDQIQNIKSKQVQNRDYTKEYLDLMNDVVDLGLPSGTLWSKYNLGCDFELLNNNPKNTKSEDWNGKYYKWAEIKPSNPVDNYSLFKDGYILKYHSKDNLIQLLNDDDAAYQFNSLMHIPTKAQCNELLDNTYLKSIEEHYLNIQNLKGILLCSKINEKCLFFPNHDMEWNEVHGNTGTIKFWTSSVNKRGQYDMSWEDERLAYYANIEFYGNKTYSHIFRDSRCTNLNIRPVVNL